MPNWKKLVLYNSDATLNTLNTNAVTGSLLGTASYALNALTASFIGGTVSSASYASTASYAENARTASYYGGSVISASFAQTASYYLETDPVFVSKSGSFATTGSNVFIGNQIITGSVNVTAGITGSLLGTASNATSSSYSDTTVSASYATSSSRSDNSTSASYSNNSTTASFANTASYVNPLQQNVAIVGNLNIAGNITAQQYVVSSSVYYVTESFSSGSHIFGNSQDDTHQFTGSVLITGSLTAGSITGTLVGTASFAQTASYVENAQTASRIQGGKATHIPYFIEDTRLATSSIFQSGSASIIINQDSNTTANPEALYVWQPNTSSINVISGKGNLDNYLQLNIQNTNQGGNASSDIVATANNGNESDNYIDMGINSENFSGFLGGPNDSYLYSHGQNMWLGNINDGHNLYLFNSSSEEPVVTITSDNNVEIADRLYVSGSITGSLFGTASQAQQATSASYALTASYASNVPATASFAVSSSYALSASFAANSTHATNADTAVSASHAVNADTAINANYATTAGNGGVTQIVAGSGISLLPTGGQGAVTVIATGVGGVTIISGSNITGSFTNSDTWVFNHNLGVRTPIITVFDSQYNQIIPQNIQLTDTGSATITFPTQESGFVVASLGGATGTVLSSSYALQSTYSTTASYYSETDPIFVSKSGSYATTGSNIFVGNQTVTGSFRTSGSNTLVGNTSLTGSLSITGSTLQSGNNTLVGNTVLSGSIKVSGSQEFTGTSTFIGNQTVSGLNTIIGSTTLSGSLEVSGSSNFHNSEFIVTGSMFVKGVTNISGSTNITGSLNVVDGNINVVSGSSFTRWGNKLFNYAQFAETASMPLTQNVSGAFQLPTTYFNDGILITSGSRITFENTGLYNIQFSAVVNQGAGKPNFSIWFRQTGSNIANSNTVATIESNSQTLLAWNFAYPFAAGSYVEMWYHTTTTNTTLTGIAATNGFPAAPALIVTVTQIA